jgi:RNA polymerase sigma-70 factor (ECF subfamily)
VDAVTAHQAVLAVLPPAGDISQNIVRRLADADAQALTAVYRAHHTAVRALARRLGMGDEAEDVVHDVFIALPSAIDRFRGDGTLIAFLRGLTVNVARHHRRSAARRMRIQDAVTREDRGELAAADTSAYRARLVEQAVRAVSELPWNQRVAFVLCELEQLTSGEVAELVGSPEATIRTRLFHARRKLRELYGPGAHDIGGTP